MTTQVDTNTFGRFAPSDYALKPDHVRVFGGFRVVDPRPGSGVRHAVTHDAVVSPDGGVTIEVNGVPVPEVGKRPGSHIP